MPVSQSLTLLRFSLNIIRVLQLQCQQVEDYPAVSPEFPFSDCCSAVLSLRVRLRTAKVEESRTVGNLLKMPKFPIFPFYYISVESLLGR